MLQWGERVGRRVAAAIVAGGLAGCGGGGLGTVGGTVSGLAAGTAVTLSLNGDETLVVGANGSFAFRDELIAGRRYDVTIVGQPARATCTVANASGRIDDNASDVRDVAVTCVAAGSVGGTVSGLLAGTSVTLQNNGADALTLSANGPFAFPTLLAPGTAYEVTVSEQPEGMECTVVQGTGSMPAADVTNVAVTCAP